MNIKTLTGIILFILLSFSVAGMNCSNDLSIELNPSTFIANSNNTIQLKINPSGAPMNVWKIYDNATLNLPIELVNQSTIFKNLITSANPTESYIVNPSSTGTFAFNISIMNETGGSCILYKNVTVNPNTQPNLTVTMDNLTSLIINQPINFTSTINNSGNGTAYNTVKQFSGDVSITNFNIGTILNDTQNTTTNEIVVNSCGLTKSITVSAKNYDSNGMVLPTKSSSDTFDVYGHDLNVISFNPSDNTPNAGATINLNATVKNLANSAFSYNATGINTIDFYYNNSIGVSTLITSKDLNNTFLTKNSTQNISTTWTIPNAGGNYTVYTILNSEYECDLSNNKETSFIESQGVVSAPTPAPVSSGSSGGSSYNGGGIGYIKAQFVDFTMTKKVTRVLRKQSITEFEINEEKHSATLSKITKEYIELTIKSEVFIVTLGIDEEHKIDFDNDGVYDLKLTLHDITNYVAKVTFEKINTAYTKTEDNIVIEEPKEVIQEPKEELTNTTKEETKEDNPNQRLEDPTKEIIDNKSKLDSLKLVGRNLLIIGLTILIVSLIYINRKKILGFFFDIETKKEEDKGFTKDNTEEVKEKIAKKEEKKIDKEEKKEELINQKEKTPVKENKKETTSKKSLKQKFKEIFFEEVKK